MGLIRRATLAALALGVLVVPGSAAAAQHQNGYAYLDWAFLPQPAWNVDAKVIVERTANSTFHAVTYDNATRVSNGAAVPGSGGYSGLQQTANGSRIALFQLNLATQSTPGPGATCRPYTNEGVGRTCSVPYLWNPNHWYTMRLWRVSRTTTTSTWGAWVISDTGAETKIADITVPWDYLIGRSKNFIEYYGAPVACNALSPTAAWWLAPRVNGGGPYAPVGTPSVGSCSGGSAGYSIYGTGRLALGGA